MKLIVGLGNPEDKYAGVRHNLGFEILDELVKKLNLVDWSMEDKFKAEIIKAPELILVKPQTYMNNSGLAVKLLSTYYKLPTTDIIVVHDDLDLMLGKIKVSMSGSGAGHRGVESIISALGTDQFVHVRVGIGSEKSHSGEHQRVHFNADKFVMEPFESKEKAQLKHITRQVVEVLTNIL